MESVDEDVYIELLTKKKSTTPPNFDFEAPYSELVLCDFTLILW